MFYVYFWMHTAFKWNWCDNNNNCDYYWIPSDFKYILYFYIYIFSYLLVLRAGFKCFVFFTGNEIFIKK